MEVLPPPTTLPTARPCSMRWRVSKVKFASKPTAGSWHTLVNSEACRNACRRHPVRLQTNAVNTLVKAATCGLSLLVRRQGIRRGAQQVGVHVDHVVDAVQV